MRINFKDQLLVGSQFVLFILFTINFDRSLGCSHSIRTISLFVSIIGFLIILLALLQLNKNLSPFPTPKDKAILIQNGLYKYVRHPIYSGILLLFFGYSLYQDSWYKLGISTILVLLLYYKTDYEEQLLQQKFKGYNAYKSKTGKFFPKIINYFTKKKLL
jgi:protein-S-isoprenylcysteine O-methyltransferase Ste14